MANAALIEASLIKSFNAPPQSRDVYVFDGDSITEGYLTTQLQNYQRQSEGMFKYPGRFYNVSVWGNTTEQQITNYPTYAAHLYNPQARNNIISMAAGTNSLGAAGESETVAYGRADDLCRAGACDRVQGHLRHVVADNHRNSIKIRELQRVRQNERGGLRWDCRHRQRPDDGALVGGQQHAALQPRRAASDRAGR